MTQGNKLSPLAITDFPIDNDCVGSKWAVENDDQLAKLIAIVVMGQAAQAAHIIDELIPAEPAFTNEALQNEAIIKFTVQEEKQTPRKGYPRHQRDGLIFEIISWIAAKQVAGDKCYLKDPHTSATSQGLDGIMIELSGDFSQIEKATIFEDKCTENPRDTFRDNVIPGFVVRHSNTRNAELIAAAASLIQLSGVANPQAMQMVSRVIDNSYRHYRAAFALTEQYNCGLEQQRLFKDYSKLENITQSQRIGASLIVEGELRDWFDSIAIKIIGYIQDMDEEQA